MARSQRQAFQLGDRLAQKMPWLAQYWDAEENARLYDLAFDEVYVSCRFRFRFKCPKCGHRWTATIRALQKTPETMACPACRQESAAGARAERARKAAEACTSEQARRDGKGTSGAKAKQRISTPKEFYERPVVGVNRSTGEIRPFGTAREASKEIDCYPSDVVYCCEGIKRSARGFGWHWADTPEGRRAAAEESARAKGAGLPARAALPAQDAAQPDGAVPGNACAEGAGTSKPAQDAPEPAQEADDGFARFYRAEFDVRGKAEGAEVWPVVVETAYDWLSGKEEARRRARSQERLSDLVDWDAACAWSPDLAMSRTTAARLAERIKADLADFARDTSVEARRAERTPALLDGEFVDLQELFDGVPCAAAVTSEFAFGMDASANGVRAATAVENGEDGLPETWRLVLEEGAGKPRRWRTTVETHREAGACRVSVTVETSCDEEGAKFPSRKQPRLVDALLARDELSCDCAGIALSRTARAVQLHVPDDFASFVAEAKDRRRAVPFVVVGSDASGRFPCDVDELARRVSGVATVRTLSWRDSGVKHRLDASFAGADRDLRPVEGAVNVYLGACRGEGDPARAVVDPGARGFQSALEVADRVLGIAAERATSPYDVPVDPGPERADDAPFDGPEAPAASDQAEAEPSAAPEGRVEDGGAEADAREAAVGAMAEALSKACALLGVDASAVAQGAFAPRADDGALSALEDLLHESQEALDAQKRAAEELQARNADLAGKCAALEARADAAESEAERLRGLESGAAALEEIPSSMDEVVDLAERTFTGRLAFADKAHASAKADETGGYLEAWRILRALDQVLWPILFDDGQEEKGRAAKVFQDRTGFELAWNESEGTENSARGKSARTVTWHGRKVSIGPHVKGQSGNKTNRLRVYFYVDRDERTIVVGSCGNHLETEGSRRRSI